MTHYSNIFPFFLRTQEKKDTLLEREINTPLPLIISAVVNTIDVEKKIVQIQINIS